MNEYLLLIKRYTRESGRATGPSCHFENYFMMLHIIPHTPFCCLARSTGGNVEARSALLSASDAVARPGPVGAAALTAEDVDVGSRRSDGTLDVLDSETSDWDTGGGLASRRAVLVVLLDDNSVLGDVLEGDVLVADTRDGTGGARDGLDADTVVRVGDGGVRDDDVLDGVVLAATYGADGDAVSAGAGTAGEVDVSARVDGQAVVLVLDVRVGDVYTGRATNIESIGVVAAVGNITSGVVDGDLVKSEVLCTVDGETLHRCVLDVESSDGGRGH
jgi:hypothetical protein